MLSIYRNILHITENKYIDDSENSDDKKDPIDNKLRLKNFKIEVGKCCESNFFCLFLVTGFTKITFGFEKPELLEVIIFI